MSNDKIKVHRDGIDENGTTGGDVVQVTMTTTPNARGETHQLTTTIFPPSESSPEGFSEYNLTCRVGSPGERHFVDQPGRTTIEDVAEAVGKLPTENGWNPFRSIVNEVKIAPAGGNPIENICRANPPRSTGRH